VLLRKKTHCPVCGDRAAWGCVGAVALAWFYLALSMIKPGGIGPG